MPKSLKPNIVPYPVKEQAIQVIQQYFDCPFGDRFFVYNNLITVNELQTHTWRDLLSHARSINLGGQYERYAGKSICMLTHEAVKNHYQKKTGESIRGKTVLDVGCSIGHFAGLMAEDGAKVTAIDVLKPKVDVASAIVTLRGLSENLKVIHGYIEDYMYAVDEHFDLILMHNVFEGVSLKAGQPIGAAALQTATRKWAKNDTSRTASVVKRLSELSNLLYTTILVGPDYVVAHSNHTQYKLLLPKIYGKRSLWVLWH